MLMMSGDVFKPSKQSKLCRHPGLVATLGDFHLSAGLPKSCLVNVQPSGTVMVTTLTTSENVMIPGPAGAKVSTLKQSII